MEKELIIAALKSLKKEKTLLKKMVEKKVEEDAQENIEHLQSIYKMCIEKTTFTIEEIIKRLKENPISHEELTKLITSCSNSLFKGNDRENLAVKLEQLIMKQISLHKNINFCLPNLTNMETYASIKSINGEHSMILYSLMLDLAKNQKDPNVKKMIIEKITYRFLSDEPIRYMFSGDNELAEYFCNPNLFLDENFINNALHVQSNVIMNDILETVQMSSIAYEIKNVFPDENTKEVFHKLIEYDLTAYLIQYNKHGYVPKINLESLDPKTLSRIKTSAQDAYEYAKKYNFESRSKMYRKAK